MEEDYKKRYPTIASDKENVSESWGGNWTERKLDAFEKYVKAYLTIMNKYRDKYHYQLIYFDGFAGSGDRIEDEIPSKDTMDSLFPMNDVNIDEFRLYKGAAERVAAIANKIKAFDYYYFVEKDPSSRGKLMSRLSIYHLNNVEYKEEANEQLHYIAEKLRRNRRFRALVLLDPFGMQIDWSSIQLFQGLNIDLFILIPTGVIVNRLLDKKGNLTHIDKLTKFFGLPETEIRSYFYRKTTQMTLFGEETTIEKAQDPINKIAALYISKLKNLFKYVVDKPLVLRNSKNVPIYHFAFAAQNKTARKIAEDIIGKENTL